MITSAEVLAYLKPLFSDYRIIDGSSIGTPISLGISLISILTKPMVILIFVRSDENADMFNLLDECRRLRGIAIDTEFLGPLPDIYICNRDNMWDYAIRECEEIVRSLRLRLESDTNNDCYICSEKIETPGHCCQVCFKAPCNKCSMKLVEDGGGNCPICRNPLPITLNSP